MPAPRFLDPSGRPLPAPKSIVVRTTKAPALGHLLHSLGLAVAKQKAADGSIFLTVECDGLLLKIIPATETSDPREAMFHFAVDSLDAALKIAADREAAVLRPPHQSSWGKRAIIADPDGRRIVLTELGTLPGFAASTTPTIAGIELPADLPTVTTDGFPIVRPITKSASAASEKLNLNAGTPLDILPAMRAAKNGMIFQLVALAAAVIFIIFVVGVQSGMRNARNSVVDDDIIALAALFGQFLVFLELLTFRFPSSPKVRYGCLHAAIILHVAVNLLFVVSHMVYTSGQKTELQVVSIVSAVVSQAIPILLLIYLAHLARKAADDTTAGVADLLIGLHLGWCATILMMIGAIWISSFAALIVVLVVMLIVSITYLVNFVRLALRFINFRPIAVTNAEILFVPTSLETVDEPIRINA